MYLSHFEHVKPASFQETLVLLKESGSRSSVLAGGTDLLMNMKLGVTQPDKVVSIRSLPELGTVSLDDDGNLTIGACCTLSQLARHPLLADFPALSNAIKSVASKHIRNIATIGGNLCLDTRCWYYNQSRTWRASREPCLKTGGNLCHAIKNANYCSAINKSDTAPVLMAMNAQVIAKRMGSERTIPISEFFSDDGMKRNSLKPQEVVTEIKVPPSAPDGKTVFLKVANRKGIDFALGSVAASVKGEQKGISSATLIIGALTSAPVRLAKAASIIVESGLNDKSIQAAAEAARSDIGTVTNLFNSSGYKRDLAQGLTKKALIHLKESTVQ